MRCTPPGTVKGGLSSSPVLSTCTALPQDKRGGEAAVDYGRVELQLLHECRLAAIETRVRHDQVMTGIVERDGSGGVDGSMAKRTTRFIHLVIRDGDGVATVVTRRAVLVGCLA